MDENHQDKTEGKSPAAKDKSPLSPLPSQDQSETDQLQKNQMEDTIKQLRHHGYKVTEEYDRPGHLSKVSGEHPQRKTLWDWLQLFIIPLVLLLIGAWFSYRQNEQQLEQQSASAQMQATQVALTQAQALDQQRAAILQTYIDNIQDLILKYNLPNSKPDDGVSILARARTLTALQRLDGDRKGVLLQFLYEAKLIGFQDKTSKVHSAIIDLSNADLTDVYLADVNLNDANLSGAILERAIIQRAKLRGTNLSGADLIDALLVGTDFSGANLSRAILRKVYLNQANLSGANLADADLEGANLSNANLSGAVLTTIWLLQEQLDQVSSCKNAILPPGLTCHYNQ